MLMNKLWWAEKSEVRNFVVLAGAGVVEITAGIHELRECDTLGVSIFGNRLEQATTLSLRELHHVASSKATQVVYFVGGYAEKYGYSADYDTRMNFIRHVLRHSCGAVVEEAAEHVRGWEIIDPLGPDCCGHISAAHSDDLAEFWCALLRGQPLPPPCAVAMGPAAAAAAAGAPPAEPLAPRVPAKAPPPLPRVPAKAGSPFNL